MIESYCGLHCSNCTYKLPCQCGGCIETNGHPFHGECPVALCCQEKHIENCGECSELPCQLLTQYSCDPKHGDTPSGARIEQCRAWITLKRQLINEFNSLQIADMDKVTDLYQGKGSFVNIQYTLSSGQIVKLLDDEKTYYIHQLCKKNSDRCYGLVGDDKYLLVCEYGENGTNAEILIYKRWN